MAKVIDARKLFAPEGGYSEEYAEEILPGIYLDPQTGEMITVYAGETEAGRSVQMHCFPRRFQRVRRFHGAEIILLPHTQIAPKELRRAA